MAAPSIALGFSTTRPGPDEYVSLAEAAKLLGDVRPNTLRKAVKRGRLGPVRRSGKRTAIVRWGDVLHYRESTWEARSAAQHARRSRERAERAAEFPNT